MNRRMRNRMYGGVRGRRGQPRPLLDTVVSTMTRSNSAGRMAVVCTAVSMVALSSSSTPASPMAVRKRPIWVESQGSVGVY